MINARDTFYLMLRDRIAGLNPSRTMVLRGVVRPGVLVEENELSTVSTLEDVYRVRWTAMEVNALLPLPLVTMTCEINYATSGTAANGGMDRGRLLSAMDLELLTALRTTPHNIVKMSYAGVPGGKPPIVMGTNVFWSDAAYKATKSTAEMLERVVTVEVFCYQEVGE